MNIKGKRINLRAIEKDDLSYIQTWFNDPDIASGLGAIHFPTSASVQERWFESIQKNERTVRLAVEDEDGSLIGLSGFWDICWRDRRAESSILIGDKSKHGKGYGREIIVTCAKYAFEEMDLFRLDATILANNIGSLELYKSCGFVVEGTLRGHSYRQGSRIDRVFLGLLADEYRVWAKENKFWD